MKKYQNVILIVLVLLALTNPSETDHDNAVLNRDSSFYPQLSAYLKNKTTKVNLVLFSFTQIQRVGNINSNKNLEKKIIGFGILGNVFLFSDSKILL
jgi:hypothetical protein